MAAISGIPPSLRHDIEQWIALVSSHPDPIPVCMPTDASSPTYVHDSDGDDRPNRKHSSTVTGRTAKRSRADSSPIADRVRVIVSRKASQIDLPFPRDPTPTASELGAPSTSAASSDVDSVDTTATKCTSKSQTEKERRNRAKIRRQNAADPAAELAACIQRIKTSTSAAYDGYEYPIIDDSVTPPKYYIFICKACGENVRRQIGTAETTRLLGHSGRCPGHPQETVLDNFGITGGSARMTVNDVRERVALWVSESARPYQIVKDRQLQPLYHPDVRKHLPHRTTVSQDIKRIYEAAQNDIASMLAEIQGVFHIGLDLCQVDNGQDFLGIVLFRSKLDDKKALVDRFVLECLNFSTAHTGIALAKAVYAVLCKFKIEHRVWGVVCDNASNNTAMMDHLGKFNLKRLNGALARTHCLLHILNLVAQAVMDPFSKKRQALSRAGEDDSDDEIELVAEFDLDEEGEIDDDDDGMAASRMLMNEDEEENPDNDDDDDQNEEECVPEIVAGSAEERDLIDSTMIIWKVSKFAHNIRYSPRERAAFRALCEERSIPTPHNVRRDVKTRWNSTENMLQDAERTFSAIVAYQRAARVPRSHRLNDEDQAVISTIILSLLEPLRILTEICSQAGVPLLADVLVHFDGLHFEYSKICNNKTKPLYVRQAADRARRVLNKYYQKTDDSELYRLALLLHPSMRAEYLKYAEWEPDWIETAIEIAEDCWKTHYKLSDASPSETEAPKTSQFAYSTYLDKMYAALDETQDSATCPVRRFVNAPRVMDTSNGKPTFYNPLTWWHGQRVVGNEWDGLTQMAIDVLSTPAYKSSPAKATSVDVERAFSFVGSIVSKRRHRLAPYSIQATATLGFYSKAGLVKRGCLAKARSKLSTKAAPQDQNKVATTKA